jgi:hypothetical protein
MLVIMLPNFLIQDFVSELKFCDFVSSINWVLLFY